MASSALFALAAAAQALAFYTYSGARPFLLAFWAGAALLFWRGAWARRRALAPAAVVFAALLAPSLWAMFGGSGAGMGRFTRVSIFGAGLSPLGTAGLFLKNYAAHFSPAFLFFTGDANLRHGVPGFGVLLTVEAIWLVAGLCLVGRRCFARDSSAPGASRLLLLWFVLFPVSAALTNEGIPHALRTLHAVPAPQIVGAIGAVWCCDWLRRRSGGRLGAMVPVVLTALNGAWLAGTLFVVYSHQSYQAFGGDISTAVEWFREGPEGPAAAGRLYVAPGVDVFESLLFHLRTDPAALQGLPLERYPVQPIGPNQVNESTLRALRPGDGLLTAGPNVLSLPRNTDQQSREGLPDIESVGFGPFPSPPWWWPGSHSQPQASCVLYWRPRAH